MLTLKKSNNILKQYLITQRNRVKQMVFTVVLQKEHAESFDRKKKEKSKNEENSVLDAVKFVLAHK